MRKYKFAILGAGSIAEKMAETVIHMPPIIPYAVAPEIQTVQNPSRKDLVFRSITDHMGKWSRIPKSI